MFCNQLYNHSGAAKIRLIFQIIIDLYIKKLLLKTEPLIYMRITNRKG